MNKYKCPYCDSADMNIESRTKKKVLMCSMCGNLVKWLTKKELSDLKIK